jgi:hemoglobin-like flavoprotein
MPNVSITMTATQRRLLRDSFELLRQDARPFTLLFYGKLFEMDPSARRLFHNDIALQGRKLIDTLAAVVGSLDDFQPMRSNLAELGRKHAGYGVRPEQYEILTSALLWSMGQALEADFDAATRDAWKLALTAISAAMQSGTE